MGVIGQACFICANEPTLGWSAGQSAGKSSSFRVGRNSFTFSKLGQQFFSLDQAVLLLFDHLLDCLCGLCHAIKFLVLRDPAIRISRSIAVGNVCRSTLTKLFGVLSLAFALCAGGATSQHLVERLNRFVEYDLLVVLTDNSFPTLFHSLRIGSIRVKLQTVPESLWFFVRLGDEIELDLDLEFTPSCFGDFEGWLLDGAHVLGVGFVQFELDLL